MLLIVLRELLCGKSASHLAVCSHIHRVSVERYLSVLETLSLYVLVLHVVLIRLHSLLSLAFRTYRKLLLEIIVSNN